LSKAPLRSAFLKTGRIRVKYSHNTWTKKGGRPQRISNKSWLYKPRRLNSWNWSSAIK